MINNTNDNKSPSNKLTIRLSWSFVCTLLLIFNAVTVYLWKPWNTVSEQRKITVTGESLIQATPDEYVLTPYFEYSDADKSKAMKQLSEQSVTVTAKLKELGVKDEQIKSTTSSYDTYAYSSTGTTNDKVQLYYTIKLNSKDVAQKVQDYLLTLNPKGQISPQASFSESKRKELNDKAREEAIADAKSNARKTAEQLKVKVGKVITVSDGVSGGPIAYGVALDVKSSSAETSSLPIQTGQDEYRYSVTVEYEVK